MKKRLIAVDLDSRHKNVIMFANCWYSEHWGQWYCVVGKESYSEIYFKFVNPTWIA